MISRYHRPHEMYKEGANTKLQSSDSADIPLKGNVPTPPPPPPVAFPPPPDVTSPPSRGSSTSDNIGFSGKGTNNAATLPAGEAFDKNGDLDLPKRRINKNRAKFDFVHLLSGLYAELFVVAAAIMSFSEVLTNQIPLFFFHGYLYTYLIGGAIIALIGVYVTMMVDKFPRLTGALKSNRSTDEDSAPFKRISYYTTDVYIYLRMGLVFFGLGTLISTGLEIGTIFTIDDKCMDGLNLAQPFLRGLFTFLQMHFLFMNAHELLKSLGWFRHVALMHLVSTNIAIWIRLLLFETTFYWLQSTHVNFNASLTFPDHEKGDNITIHTLDYKGGHKTHWAKQCFWTIHNHEEMEDVLEVYYCLQNTTIGEIWEKSLPYLSPCIVQYSLLSAAITYYLWENIGNPRPSRKSLGASVDYDATRIIKRRKSLSHLKLDCQASSKGLFLGLILLVAGVIVLIVFFVMAHDKKFETETVIAFTSMHCAVLVISALATVLGIFQIQRVYTKPRKPQEFHGLLQTVGLLSVYGFGFLNMIVGATNITSARYLILFIDGAFMIIQAFAQSMFVHNVGRKSSSFNSDFSKSKPGRQVVAFLVFSNLVLWLMESFVTQDKLATKLQMEFYGELPWGVVSRISLPLVIFYRFHSSAALVESWKRSYKTTDD